MTEAPAIRSGDSVRTTADAQGRAARLAGALRAYGVKPGERVAVILRNEIAFLEAGMAAAAAGAVPVPVNCHWTGDDLAYLLSDSGSVVAFVHTDLLTAVEAVAPRSSPAWSGWRGSATWRCSASPTRSTARRWPRMWRPRPR